VKGRKVKGRGRKCPNCGTRMEYVSISFSYCSHCRIRRKNPPEFIKKIKFEKKERKKLEKQVKIWTSKNTSQEELRRLAGGRAFSEVEVLRQSLKAGLGNLKDAEPFPMEFCSFQESTGDGV